jgi:acetylornithine/N-succinyldiaminopimelate aminotransferase
MKELNRSTFDEVMVPNYNPAAIIPSRGKGCQVWDTEGREYIDLAGGIAVNGLGHCHPELVAVLKEQAEKLWHVSNVWTNEKALELASKLIEHTFAERIFFCNSGGEANEAAFKTVRKYAHDHFGPEKSEIISFNNSFHGRTLFTVSVGGQPKYTQGFEPLPAGITHLNYNDLSELEAHISERTCAVVMEPIMAEGGIINGSPEFVKGVRALCDKYNALLVFDEVQTGMGRTGELYAYMGMDVTPDIVTSAKALGGGFPIGAMLTTAKVASSMVVGTHGSTYGGNPLACAVGSKVVDIVTAPGFLNSVKQKREVFEAQLSEINARHGVFSEIRGRGLLIGCALNDDWQGKARLFLDAAVDEGLMILVAGPSVIRLAPPLIISDDQIIEAMARFDRAISKVLSAQD